MYNTLLMQIQEPVEDLRHVQSNEVFRKSTEVLRDGMQRAILTIPTVESASDVPKVALTSVIYILQDDVQSFSRFHKSVVLDDIGVL